MSRNSIFCLPGLLPAERRGGIRIFTVGGMIVLLALIVGLVILYSTPTLESAFPLRSDWSAEQLVRVREIAGRIGSTAVIVIHDGGLVTEWGDTTKRTSSHSVRKSLISALYGIAIDQKFIDPAATLADLGIDDLDPLSEVEKGATVRHLLMSRSGVYHPAAYESAKMKATRPKRHSHPPGTHWYYNNWDFNVLGTIFEQETGLSIGRAFKDWIADPIGMQDFRIEDVHPSREPISIHAAYPFYVSARDLARFGVLYLQDGLWGDRRILPRGWVTESTTPYSMAEDIGYGCMWWVYRDLAFYAEGFGGQYIIIIPTRKLVIVNRVDSGRPGFERRHWFRHGDRVDQGEILTLVDAILEAAPTE